MKKEYEFIVKIEYIPSPSGGGKDLRKTWEDFILLEGNEKVSADRWGRTFMEVILDRDEKYRVARARVIVEWPDGEYDSSTIRAPFIFSQREEGEPNGSENKAYNENEFALLSAQINEPVMQEIETELKKLQRLPSDIANNSQYKPQILFGRYVLFEMGQWYEEANIESPIDLKTLLSITPDNPILSNKTEQRSVNPTLKEKFLKACEEIGLPPINPNGRNRISDSDLYQIGKIAFEDKMPLEEEFTSRHPLYAELRQYASLVGRVNRRGT